MQVEQIAQGGAIDSDRSHHAKHIQLTRSTNNLIVCSIAARPGIRTIERRCWWSSIALVLPSVSPSTRSEL